MTARLTLLACLLLAACSGVPGFTGNGQKQQTLRIPAILPQTQVPQDRVDAFATAFLDSIQAQSIAERREFCGYFFKDRAGNLRATPPRRGTFATCNMPAPGRYSGVFASYHTHGAYGASYDNEVPSVTDLQSDFSLGLDGYVSTPGGRIWRVNRDTRDTEQVCGLGCVTRDPGFVPRNESGVFERYTLLQLALRNGA